MARSKFKHLLLLLITTVALGGCAIKVAYQLLDVALLWALDDYIDFDREQKAYAKVLIDDFHEWHRYTELPRYALTLHSLADALSGYIDAATVERYATGLAEDWFEVMRALADPAAKLMAQLSAAQIDELLSTMATEEREDREDYARETPADVRQERYDFIAAGAKRLAGPLTRQQEDLIEQWAADLRDLDQMTLEHRTEWRERFMVILEDRSEPDRVRRELQQLFGEPYQFWSEDYQRSVDYNARLTHQLVADLANAMTTRQRQRATHRLRGIAADFESLSASPPEQFRSLRTAAP